MVSLLILAAALHQVRMTTQMDGQAPSVNRESRWVVRMEWAGTPEDVTLETAPEPRFVNLEQVGVTRESRVRHEADGPVTVLEFVHHLQPLGPGPARIESADVVFRADGERTALRTEAVSFEVAEESAADWTSLALALLGLLGVGGGGWWLKRRRLRQRQRRDTAQKEFEVLLEDVSSAGLEELVRMAGRLGVEVPPDVLDANEASKFARREPDRMLTEGFRERVRASVMGRKSNLDSGD